jgi:hypothetical protein
MSIDINVWVPGPVDFSEVFAVIDDENLNATIDSASYVLDDGLINIDETEQFEFEDGIPSDAVKAHVEEGSYMISITISPVNTKNGYETGLRLAKAIADYSSGVVEDASSGDVLYIGAEA